MARIVGGKDDDRLAGENEPNVIEGRGGNDTLTGGTVDDTLKGGAGDDHLIGDEYDVLIGGEGDDTIEARGLFPASGYVDAGAGDDVIIFHYDAGGPVDGGDGFDRLVLTDARELYNFDISDVEALEISGSPVSATFAQLKSFETIRNAEGFEGERIEIRLAESGRLDLSPELGSTSVHIVASSYSDTITAGDGDDIIEGGGDKDVFDGGAGNDTLIGDNFGDERLIGGDGDDVLIGAAGDNTLLGGDGDDRLSSAGPIMRMEGGAGDDVVEMTTGASSGVLDGGEGHDLLIAKGDLSGLTISGFEQLSTETTVAGTIEFLKSFEDIFGGDLRGKADLRLADAGFIDLTDQLDGRGARIVGSDGDDVIVTGAGDDLLKGGRGDDELHGGAGDDGLATTAGSDTLFGGAGDDSFRSTKPGAKGVLDGGEGRDVLFARGDISGLTISGIETFETRGGYVRGTAEQFESFDVIRVSADGWDTPVNISLTEAGRLDLRDELEGRDARLFGSDGDDLLRSSGGDDELAGGAGNDTLDGGAGADTFAGGDGDDVYAVDDVRDHVDSLGDDGIDTVRASVDFRLTRDVENLVLTGSEAIDGVGNELDNAISGNGADNDLEGRGGADTLDGGDGADDLDGGKGFDTADYRSSDEAVRVDLGDGAGFGGEAESDTLVGVEGVLGSRFGDELTGDDGGNLLDGGGGDDTLDGGAGADRLIGGAGVDELRGSSGDDTVAGGAGDDVIEGGRGSDELTGGAGGDVFAYVLLSADERDVITDFAVGEDRISFSSETSGLEVGDLRDKDFALAGEPQGDAHVIYDAKKGLLLFDRDGAGSDKAFVLAEIGKGLDLSADDFFVV